MKNKCNQQLNEILKVKIHVAVIDKELWRSAEVTAKLGNSQNFEIFKNVFRFFFFTDLTSLHRWKNLNSILLNALYLTYCKYDIYLSGDLPF